MNLDKKEDNKSYIAIELLGIIYIIICSIPVYISYFQIFFNISYNIALNISLVIAVVLCTIFFKISGKIVFNFELVDCLAVLYIIFVTALQITRGDSSWDTLNYHIYAQENITKNFVNDSFFPERAINSLYWVLGDQIHYIFRYLLGFRLGTIGSSIAYLTSYFCVKSLIKKFLVTENLTLSSTYIGIVSIVILITENMLWNVNTYYTDILSLPLFLIIIDKVLFDERTDAFSCCFITYLAALCVTIKISNAYFIIPLAIIYLIRFRKQIKLKYVFIAIIIGVIPMVVYAYKSILVTGNPIFPYANNIFKSPYFTTKQSVNDIAAFKLRFGPESVLQYIFWPIYSMINKFRIVDHGVYTGRVLIICCGILVMLFSINLIKYSNKMKTGLILWIIFYIEYITVFQGYIRYVFVLETLGTIIIFCSIIKIINIYKNEVAYFTSTIVLSAIIVQSVICIYTYCLDSNGTNQYETFITNSEDNIKNAKYIYKDKQLGIDENIIEDIDVWILSYYNSAYCTLIKNDIPIVSIIKEYNQTNDYTETVYKELIEKYKEKNMYSVANIYSLNEQVEFLNKTGFTISEVKNISPYFMDANLGLILLKVEYTGAAKNKNVYANINEITVNVSNDELKGTIQIGVDAGQRGWNENVHYDVMICNLAGEENYVLTSCNLNYDSTYQKVSYEIADNQWTDQTCFFIIGNNESVGTRVIVSCESK